MQDRRSIDELKELGAGRSAPNGIVRLYHQAFREFGTIALWSQRPSEHPTIAQALVIADSLRREGTMRARPLAARSRRRAVPLSTHRNPESYVAGAAVLNQEGPRFSSDIDIFHDLEEAVAQAADSDAAVLSAQGYQVQWVRREPGIHIATVN